MKPIKELLRPERDYLVFREAQIGPTFNQAVAMLGDRTDLALGSVHRMDSDPLNPGSGVVSIRTTKHVAEGLKEALPGWRISLKPTF